MKYIINLTVPYFLGILNTGMIYSDCFTEVSTSISNRHIISLQKASLFVQGGGFLFPLHGLDIVFSSNYTGALSHFSGAPSNKYSNLLSNTSNSFLSSVFNGVTLGANLSILYFL